MFQRSSNYLLTVLFNYASIGVNAITAFMLFPIIIKHLGIGDLGVFGFFYSFKSVIDMGAGWLSASMTRNLIKFRYLKTSIFTLSFIANLAYGVIGALIFLVAMIFLQNGYLISAMYFSIYVFISFASVPFYERLVSELRQFEAAFFRFVGQFVFMILSIFSFVAIDDKSLEIIFVSLAISNILVFIGLLRFYSKQYKFELDFKHITKKIFIAIFLKDGYKYFLNGITTVLLLQMDVLLVSYLYGNESAGTYLVVWKIPSTIIMLGWRISEPFQVMVASDIKHGSYQLLDKFKKLEHLIVLLTVPIAVLYALFGSNVLAIWVGEENIPSICCMYIIPAILIVASTLQRLYVSVNYYANGLNLLTLLQFIELVFKIAFIVFAFDYFQELSPIVGWVLALVFTLFFYRRSVFKVIS